MRASEVTPGRYRFEFEAGGQIHHRDVTVFDDPQLGRVMQFDGADAQKLPVKHIRSQCSFVAIDVAIEPRKGDWVVAKESVDCFEIQAGSVWFVAETDRSGGFLVTTGPSVKFGWWVIGSKFRVATSAEIDERINRLHFENGLEGNIFDRIATGQVVRTSSGCKPIESTALQPGVTFQKLDYTDRYCELAPLVAEAYAFCKCEDFSSATDVLDRARQIISPPAWPQVIR